jgi:hypothetical protein
MAASANSISSWSSRESPAARRISASGAAGHLGGRRRLGERDGNAVDLAALEGDGPAALLAPGRQLGDPGIGDRVPVHYGVGEQTGRDPQADHEVATDRLKMAVDLLDRGPFGDPLTDETVPRPVVLAVDEEMADRSRRSRTPAAFREAGP